MTIFQILMLGASAFFAFKIYEHIQTLKDPQETTPQEDEEASRRSANSFSTFSAEALEEKADLAFEQQEFQKALALLQEADEKEANNSDRIFKMGYILQTAGDSIAALTYYKKALELDPQNQYIHNSIATIYREQKEYASARLHLNRSLEIDGTNPITCYNYGNLLVDMEHFDEAQEMYKRAVELDPNFDEAKEELQKIENR